jgi:hypothetical protein
MLKIYPTIEVDMKCPVDGSSLTVLDMVIPGMRNLADTFCPSCNVRYYMDLPTGQAMRSPITLNQNTGEIYDSRNVVWFSSLLKNAFADQVALDLVPTVHTFFPSDRIVILNCLDFLYGHSLLKLLNVQRYLDNFSDFGCCVLIPSQMVHLVPEGVAEIWEFPVPVQDGWKWYHSLQTWMKMQLRSRKECFLSKAYSHPSNKIYDLNRFVRNLPDISNTINQHNPVILFSYREDRLWGSDLAHQQKNLQKLYHRLSAVFPEMVFVIIGFGKKSRLHKNGARLLDLRCDRFERQQDLLWMAYMQRADCVIGIHGSNMLLPSGLAKTTVELVPRSRLGNSVQDFLFSASDRDLRDSLLYYRMMYGNDNLSDILPSEVTDMVVCMVSNAPYNSQWFKVGEAENSMSKANAIGETAIYEKAINYFRRSMEKSFIKRKGRQIAERILEMID